ncbi:MAG: type II secretion system major pseudopilin GspG [Methylacidiphilales bacterium]|nr:type II secretion system major pseudopilin GspG [Candidatus Methylacidiphilales bacterium]
MNIPAFYQRTLRASRRGFTLMEMLIVLTIIALLMGMVIYNIGDLTATAKPERVKADLLTFKEMLAAYQLNNGMLPTTDQGLKVLWSKPTVEPIPPRWRQQMDEEVLDPWGHPYRYVNPGVHNPDSYDIFSMGEDGLPNTEDDIGNWPDAKTTATNQ